MSNAAIVIVTNGGNVLLLKRSTDSTNGDTWGFPGGKIEVDEEPHNAAARELWEETGYGTTSPLLYVSDDGDVVTYRLEVDRFTPTLNNEHTTYDWVNPSQLPTPLHPGTEERIRQAMTTKRITDINGWYEVRDNPISKVGVFPYSGRAIGAPDPNRIYNVYRPEEELNNQATIDSFRLTPFINDHPSDMLGVDDDLPKVDGHPSEGVIGEQIYYKDGYLYANLKIFTDRIAKAITAGKKEVSAGFRCMYEQVTGTYNGQPYDYIQRKIRGNHVALVNQGRMGPEVAVLDHLKLTFDSKELIKMADEKTEVKDGEEAGAPEMTLTELTGMVKAFAPQLKALNDAMATLTAGKTDEADATVVDTDEKKEVTPAAFDALEKSVKALQAENKALKESQGKGLDAKDVFIAAAAKDTLYRGVSKLVGAFDHSAMDAQDVAKYAVGKFGLTGVPAGSEIVAVNAYLAAKPDKTAVALDGKENDGKPSAIRQHVEATA